MKQIPICVMTPTCPATMCSKFAALRNRKKVHANQIVDVTIDCGLGTAIQRDPAAVGRNRQPDRYLLLRKLWRQACELLVLRFRRQTLVGLGVVDHLPQER